MLSSPVPLAPSTLSLLLGSVSVRAGFPSPAEDFAASRLDIGALLAPRPESTFLMRLAGDSLIDLGIFEGDLLVVNRALRPAHGSLVVAVLDNEFTAKLLHLRPLPRRLKPANPAYPEIIPGEGQQLTIWGVVTHAVRALVPTADVPCTR